MTDPRDPQPQQPPAAEPLPPPPADDEAERVEEEGEPFDGNFA